MVENRYSPSISETLGGNGFWISYHYNGGEKQSMRPIPLDPFLESQLFWRSVSQKKKGAKRAENVDMFASDQRSLPFVQNWGGGNRT